MTSNRYRITLLLIITTTWLVVEAVLFLSTANPSFRYETPINILAMAVVSWLYVDFCLAALRHWAVLPASKTTITSVTTDL